MKSKDKPRDPVLDLADSYYRVARDLEEQARYLLGVTKHLNLRADALCEAACARATSAAKESL